MHDELDLEAEIEQPAAGFSDVPPPKPPEPKFPSTPLGPVDPPPPPSPMDPPAQAEPYDTNVIPER